MHAQLARGLPRETGGDSNHHDVLPESEFVFDLKDLARHYAGIIAGELARRKISARALYRDGIISRRNGFNQRLASGTLLPQETEKLLDLLQLDPFRMLATYGVKNGIDAYFSPLYFNMSQVLGAFAKIWEVKGSQLDGQMEPMRPSLCAALAERIFSHMVLHQQRIDFARDNTRDMQI